MTVAISLGRLGSGAAFPSPGPGFALILERHRGDPTTAAAEEEELGSRENHPFG